VEGQNIVIQRILPDTPAAARQDIHVGDRILAVAQDKEPMVSVCGAPLAKVAAMIRGPENTTVRLTIVSAGKEDSESRVVSIVRAELKILTAWGDGILLTSGTKAPNIEMVGLANGASERLSDYAGKIVVLEFWATWCGPCQKRMAEIQNYSSKYPDWKGKVVLIAASVDENEDVVSKHLRAKGWDQTHNVWITTDAKKAYHINAIPNAYVIDRQGKIVAANPADIPEIVNHEL
jgi:thiol-disulfide isomerase/thioredoxin